MAYTTLIIGGGGAKGYLELGALAFLETEGALVQVKRIVGVSIGAIIGLLYDAGYGYTEIIDIAIETRLFNGYSDIQLSNITERFGLLSLDAIKAKLSQKVTERYGYVPNLHDLYYQTGKEFVAVVYNLTTGKSEHKSHLNYPKLSCVDAAMQSANIPLLFYQLWFNGDVLIDGGLFDPFPIGPYDIEGERVLILTIKTCLSPTFGSRLETYVYAIVQRVMQTFTAIAKEKMSERCRHLELNTDKLDTTGITMTAKEKAELLYSGYKQAQRILTKTA